MLLNITMMAFGVGHILHWNDRNLVEFPENLKQYKDQVYQLYIKNNSIEVLVCSNFVFFLHQYNNILCLTIFSHIINYNDVRLQPKWINSMAKLTHIYVDNNKLSYFPEELSQLKNLEVLSASCNFITSIPSMLSTLKRLTQLNMSRNQIKNVPFG